MRMDEFVIGQKFAEISSGMRTEFNRLIQTIENPDLMLDGLKTAVKLGMEAIVGHMEAIMNSISDMESQARRVQEADMMVVDDRLDKVVNKVRELDCCCDSMIKGKVEQRNAESKKEMESKLVTSMAQFKIMDISFGRIIEDKSEIARLAVSIIRQEVRQNEVGWYDDLMRRAKVTILGKATSRKEGNNGEYYSVPILFTCKDRADKWDLEGIVRRAGYYPSFHWPQEMLDFVKEARKEVSN